ncbi:hypothetical protein Bgr_09200 [Bartonella grahamii as4aup]|uniref:Phage related protein n=1 Tax=Bartonella grahamii (strain as4aup) TaxID=634504 RepID=C6ADE2_BARGA|nr:DUF1376 domain-containing protein [Bartonella grahamii]ACS51198.1 hypothetical protein Bgr_09200 [Bartonella grahamii as4aup]
MSTKLAWVRCFPSDWVSDASGMTSHQISTYMMLILLMYKKRQPILENASILARISGCSVKAFNKALDFLLSDEKLIRLEDGRLWSLQVEEELNNSNENLNKFSERAQKAAKARWDKNTKDACDNANDAKHDAKHDACDAITNNTNNTNIYNKKTKTIVLAKKEIGSESLETNEQVDEPTEVAAVETTSEQIETSSDNQPPIHEQENVSQKAKRAQANRGCRLPADFEPDYDFAIAEGLSPERVKVEIAKFRDFWKACAGKNAIKRDWQAAWRNWVRRAIEGLEKTKNTNNNGGNNGNFSKDQRTRGGTGETIRNLIGATQLSDASTRYRATDREMCNSGVPMDLEKWQSIDKKPRETSFRSLSDGSKLTYRESVC